jgi:hypothetical protein
LNQRIVLPLILVLVVMFFSSVEFVSAKGNVGVIVGQTADYTYAFSGTARDSNGNLTMSVPFTVGYIETITIQEISGTNVTFRHTRDLLNGTNEAGFSWVDVSYGNGTGFFVITSANVNTGGLLYPDWAKNENYTIETAPFVNETILMKYGGETIEVNHLNYTYTVDDQPCSEDYYWEKSTGLIVKWTISGSEVVENDEIETLNLHFQKVGLEQVFYPLIDSKDYPVTVNSDSTILGFEFNQTEKNLSLNVTGLTGTSGFCNIMVPHSLLWGTFSLSMDGYALVEGDDYSQTYNGTHYIFHIGYIHSNHTIDIVASGAIPDEPEPTEPEPTEPEPTEPEPTEPEPTEPEPTEPEPTEQSEAPFITTEVAIIVAVAVAAVIGAVAYWALRKRK